MLIRFREVLAAAGAFLLISSGIAYILSDEWMAYLNDLSDVLYTGFVYSMPIICLYACWSEREWMRSWRRSPWLAAPRSFANLSALSLLCRCACAVTLPLLISQATMVAIAFSAGAKGYWDPRYAVLAHVLGVIVFLLGVAIAHFPVNRILANIIAAVAGLYAGMYFYSTPIVSPWEVMNQSMFFLGIGLILILSLGVAVAYRSGITKKSFAALVVSFISVAAIYIFGSPQPAAEARLPGEWEDVYCSSIVGRDDLLCVWNEDVYKIPTLVKYIENFTRLSYGIAPEQVAGRYVYVEPGFSEELYSSLAERGSVRLIDPWGGAEEHWAWAQLMAGNYLPYSRCKGIIDESFVFTSLAANFIYGDIFFSGARAANADLNSYWQDAMATFSSDPEEQVAQLVGMARELEKKCASSRVMQEVGDV